MYTVIVDKQVAKQIEKIPTVFRTRICDAIASLGLDPYPQGVVKLVGETGLYRIRVGDYRIVYEIQEKIITVTITKVAHRKHVYKK